MSSRAEVNGSFQVTSFDNGAYNLAEGSAHVFFATQARGKGMMMITIDSGGSERCVGTMPLSADTSRTLVVICQKADTPDDTIVEDKVNPNRWYFYTQVASLEDAEIRAQVSGSLSEATLGTNSLLYSAANNLPASIVTASDNDTTTAHLQSAADDVTSGYITVPVSGRGHLSVTFEPA